MATRPSISPDVARRALVVGALAALGFAVFGGATLWGRSDQAAVDAPTANVVVGEPGGEVIDTSSPPASAAGAPSPTSSATPRSTPTATVTPTAEPASATPRPATPEPTAGPTPPPTPEPTPEPTTVVVAALAPDDTVATFYSHVTAGEFDAAHGLWSERMKAAYPRPENLDDRFADTASIEFTTLDIVAQDEGTAVVQANIVETYDSGSSQEFIGYWDLVLVDGRWLLDAPHY